MQKLKKEKKPCQIHFYASAMDDIFIIEDFSPT